MENTTSARQMTGTRIKAEIEKLAQNPVVALGVITSIAITLMEIFGYNL